MKMRYCGNCQRYTFKEVCSTCSTATGSPHPAKFAPSDKYGEYRRRAKGMIE